MNSSKDIIEIPEYKAVETDELEEPKDIAYLKKGCFRRGKSLPYEIYELKNDRIKIKNTSYSGIIQLSEKRIHFSTKVKTNLFYMLSFLKSEKDFLYDKDIIIDLEEGESFFDILGQLFLNELQSIYKKGFYKKYVRKEENVSYLKGKFLIKEQLKNNISKNPKFFCSYEDLTYDNLENRIILKAAVLLAPLIRFNEDIKRDLLRYSLMMQEEISLTNVSPEDCNRIQLGKLNDHYETIIKFSKLILENSFIRHIYKGSSKGFNFIVNMNKVFEDFIAEVIEDIVSEEEEFQDFTVYPQESFRSLVKEGKIITKPDIVLRRKNTENEILLIIDAKYKRRESNVDYYQVIAYALAIPTVKACCLIYPLEDEEKVESTSLTIDSKKFGNKREDIKLYTQKINLLWEDELKFSDYINKIKQDVKGKLLECLEY